MNAFTGFFGDFKNSLIVLLLILSGVLFTDLRFKNDKIQRLELSLTIAKTEFFECDETLKKQNAAIKNMELKRPFEPPDTGKIEKIYVKDKTCESELKAYKRLFDE